MYLSLKKPLIYLVYIWKFTGLLPSIHFGKPPICTTIMFYSEILDNLAKITLSDIKLIIIKTHQK